MSEILTLEKGNPVLFVELDEKDEVRRFVLPNDAAIQMKVHSFVKRFPAVSLVRMGFAIVASQDGANQVSDSLATVPSSVQASYTLDLQGNHPVLMEGQGRYSKELIEQIMSTPTEEFQQQVIPAQPGVYDNPNLVQHAPLVPPYVPPVTPAVQAPAPAVTPAPSVNLADQFRQQLAQSKLNQKAEEKKSAVTPLPEKSEIEVVQTSIETFDVAEDETATTVLTPTTGHALSDKKVVNAQALLNASLQKYKEEENAKKADIRVMEPRPKGKMDIILEEVQGLKSLLTDGLVSGITGAELEHWFCQHVEKIGLEKTFSILAGRIKED